MASSCSAAQYKKHNAKPKMSSDQLHQVIRCYELSKILNIFNRADADVSGQLIFV